MITVERADNPHMVTDAAGRYALMAVPFTGGAPAHISATVVAADDRGRMKRWACNHFGPVTAVPEVVVTDGDAMWACVIALRDGALVLDVEGEAGAVVRWWLDGFVRIYA